MPRTAGLLSGQDVLTLPSMSGKIAAHIAGLGVGFLPLAMAEREVLTGRLNIIRVEIPKPAADAVIAWRPNRTGKALRWFLARLPAAVERLMSDQAPSSAGKENSPSAFTAKSK